MKYETIHHLAHQIDHLIDQNLPNNSAIIPQKFLGFLITKNFPDLYVTDYGWHKIVLGIRSIDCRIVLKVGTKRSIENDHRAYKRVPNAVRHRWFAKIFWHTKYCLLQEYGFPVTVTADQLTEIRQAVYKYGIFDVKAENLKLIDKDIKIIDANVTRFPVPTMLRKIDEVKPKLPKRLNSFVRKVTKVINA